MNKTIEKLCDAKGIQHQLAAQGTPQQNGRAERLNKTLVMKARCLLADSKLSQEWWVEAIRNANLLGNCSPSARLDLTPYQLIWGTKPNVSYLRVFGCTALVLNPKKNRKKSESTTQTGVLIGYDAHSKAYRVLVDGKIIVSTNVRFNEARRTDPVPRLMPPQRINSGVSDVIRDDHSSIRNGNEDNSESDTDHD